jgi:uncharacterized protein (TIGR02996 family)
VNQREAFLQAILDDPGDDTVRLVFADWLEEHDDPLGEFIRVQMQLCELPDDDPARLALESREQQLLAAHEREWAEPLLDCVRHWRLEQPQLPGMQSGEVRLGAVVPGRHREWAETLARYTQWEFRRGFLEHLELQADVFLRYAHGLFRRLRLRSLALRRLREFELDALAPWCVHLRSLDLSGNRLFPGSLAAFLSSRSLADLRELHLGQTGLTGEVIPVLAGCEYLRRLTTLDLGENDLGDASLQTLADSPHLAGLTHIDLGNLFPFSTEIERYLRNSFSSAGINALAESKYLTRLEHLRLNFILIPVGHPAGGNTHLRYLVRSPNAASLETLEMRGVGIHGDGLRALGQSPHLGRLARLDLCGNAIDADAIEELGDAADLPRLRSLHLGHNPLGLEGVQAISAASWLERLTTLELPGVCLDPDVEVLAKTPAVANLRQLNLARHENIELYRDELDALMSAGITAAGAAHLAASPHLGQLLSLNLSGDLLGDEGVEALAAGGNLSRLLRLNLAGVGMTDRGALALARAARLGGLSGLNLEGNPIGPAGARALVESPCLRNLTFLALSADALDQESLALLGERFGMYLHLS